VGQGNNRLLVLVLHVKVWRMMLLRIHEQHPDDDAIEHADYRHIPYLSMMATLRILT
jgi:hypothetical protein